MATLLASNSLSVKWPQGILRHTDQDVSPKYNHIPPKSYPQKVQSKIRKYSQKRQENRLFQ